jgi:hypothetical protein
MVSQSGFVQEMLRKFKCDKLRKPPSSPSTASLLEVPLVGSERCDHRKFLSLAMTLMFLARFTWSVTWAN